MFENVDAYLILSEVNRFYFTKIKTSFGCLIMTPTEKIFITDFRYASYVKQTLKDFSVLSIKGGALMQVINENLKRLGVKRVGFEEESVTVSMFNTLTSKCPSFEFVPVSRELVLLRSIKTPMEVSLMTQAQRIAEKALAKVVDSLKPGISEKEMAAAILYEMQMQGADDKSFDTIVAFGENSAVPHHESSDRRLEKNDVVLVDMGAKYKGYCSDMTRTFFFGTAQEELATIYGIVLEAQLYALKHIKAGITGLEADSLAREYITANGYGDQFGHSLGHSVGIELHEWPTLSTGNQEVLKPGMIVTVEPGIYVDGLGGVRIEDMVVVTEDGVNNLTEFDKSIDYIK